ncbi:glutathione S-transferase family protein [Croceibacterium aestuarii]|uniref:glutathione S-transferase family protein n=1 Tax=Croceibacterium aestuarii TaxID=3064139 RepID=UPI00272E2C1F|nr:glutathione S-transferase family protein [Croceibacterium sp. D39]
MAAFTFFYNPMSRAQIARWALHEVGADYDPVLVRWDDKPAAFVAANPMQKLPTIIHHLDGKDQVVTEAAAICHYLALTHRDAGLLPTGQEQGDYFRWLLFAAGPVEQAVTSKAMGWNPTDRQEMTVGFGSFDRTIDALDGWFADHDYVCGSRFTMSDVYVGSAVDWGLQFGTMPERTALKAYAERCRARPAYQEGKRIDTAEMQTLQGEG